MQYQIRELGIGGILDQAVALTKNHFGLLIGVTLVLQVPFGLLTGFATLSLTSDLPPTASFEEQMAAERELTSNPLFWAVNLVAGIGSLFIVIPITNAAVIHAVASAYLGKPTTVGGAMSRALRSVIPLLWTWLLYSLAIFGGLLLLIIPGILFAFWFSLSSEVVVLEGINGSAALTRSKQLMKGHIGTVFALWLLLFVIIIAISFGFRLLPGKYLQTIGSVFAQAVATVFTAAAFVVFYFSARCEHENFDLTLLAQAVGEEPPPHESSGADRQEF